jgi:HK97 family phage major capsid protein
MSLNIYEAKSALADLTLKATAIRSDTRMNDATKIAKLEGLAVEQRRHQETLNLHAKSNALMIGGESLNSNLGEYNVFGRPLAGAQKRAPRLSLDEDQLFGMFQAAKTKQSLRIETKTPMAGYDNLGQLPTSLLPGIVSKQHEPVRLLDHIPASPMSGPSIEFISYGTTSGGAGVVARGALKPELSIPTVATILTARKIAVTTAVVDEVLYDFEAFTQYIQVELLRAMTDAENDEILNGIGTGEHLTGLLNASGILTRNHSTVVAADATATGLDTLEMAITDLRTGTSFTEPDAIVMNPATWGKLRRTKTSYGQYLLNADPASSEANSLWGIPVLVTTTCAAGTALVANLEIGAAAFIRNAPILEVSNSANDDFLTNTTRFRAEERLTLGVTRPSALLKVTNL